MKSPFPGMDPYLEQHWRDVHTSLMVYARDSIQARLPGDLIARVEEGIAIDRGDDNGRFVYPDVRVVEDQGPKFDGNGAAGAVAVAEPVIVEVDPQVERHIAIVDPSSGGRVVTAIEVLSPTNKIAEGRAAYRSKQAEYIAGGVNLVEIDLIRAGDFILAMPDTAIPKKQRKHYAACVRRVTRPRKAEYYGTPLRKRLPVIRIPLRPGDRDIALDIQELIDLCYERGRYHKMDYSETLDPPLPASDAVWAEKLIREWQKKREL
jgi:hypothetical protein